MNESNDKENVSTFVFAVVVNVKQAGYGQNTDLPILMDFVQCTGSEQGLLNCSYDPLTTEDTHAEDAGLICFYEDSKHATFKVFSCLTCILFCCTSGYKCSCLDLR